MKYLSSSLIATTLSLFCYVATSQHLVGIPTTPYTVGTDTPTNTNTNSGTNFFNLSNVEYIVVDSEFAQSRDIDGGGLTLIPPSLEEFSKTFARDLNVIGINATVVVNDGTDTRRPTNSIFLTVGNKSDYLDVAGRPTSEGYTLLVEESGITIKGASALGAWWGTRTVMQQAILGQGNIVIGTGVDAPGWRTRGMASDVGRHFYTKEFLIDMCAYMSFFKQNTFHLHLVDNIVDAKYTADAGYQEIYARFRLWSDNPALQGLNKYKNESYTRTEFEAIQTQCAARGVTIMPEIESPGHALVISQWKPQLGLARDMSLLNITHPETIPTIKSIWKEFLPWIHSKVVSIGADEYYGPKQEYKDFINTMNSFIRQVSGNKTMRIWGTFPPEKGLPVDKEISKDVSIQDWTYSFTNALHDYIQNNYSVINSQEMFYVVLKGWYYYPTIDLNIVFHGNPVNRGPWYPNIFHLQDPNENPARSEPLVDGAIAPLWNDRGANTSVYSEAYWAWREGLPAIADKQWGGNLTRKQLDNVLPKLIPYIPGQNLEKRIPSEGNEIFNYNLHGQDQDQDQGRLQQRSKIVKDSSGNQYDAHTSCNWTDSSSLTITSSCALTTLWESKGRNYTLQMTLKVEELPSATNTTLLVGTDSLLMLTPNITFFSGGVYYRLNTTVPIQQWIDLKIIGRGERTFAQLTADGKTLPEEEFLAKIGENRKAFHWRPMAFEAPIKHVTGWIGQLKQFSLTNTA